MSKYLDKLVSGSRRRTLSRKKQPKNEMVEKHVTSTGQFGWHVVQRGAIADHVFSTFNAEQLGEIYTKSGLVYACVREKSTSIAEAPLEIGKINEDGDFEAIKDHPILDLFYNNPNFSYTDLIRFLVDRIELTGANWYILSPFKNRVGIGEITPLPTNLLTPIVEGVRIVRYERLDRKKSTFEPEEVCAHMYLDPNRLHGFLSPLETVIRETEVDDERLNLTMQTLKNKKIPGLILEQVGPAGMNEPQRQELVASVKEALGQEHGATAETLVLPKNIKARDGVGLMDIDYSILNSLTETRICMAYQVPPIIIGAQAGLERSTYANYKEARKSYMSETIVNLWNFIQDGFTRSILRAQGEKVLVFKFNTNNIKELQKDTNEISKRAQELFKEGVIKKEEARAMIEVGLEELPPEEQGFKQVVTPDVPRETNDDDDDDETGQKKTSISLSGLLKPSQQSGRSRSQVS